MKSLLQKNQGNWSKFREALLEWRNTPRSGTHISPSEMLLNRRQRTLLPTMNKQKKTPVVIQSKDDKLHQLEVGTKVYIQDPKNKKWDRKGMITEVCENGRSYFVDIEDKRVLRNRKILRPV